MSGSISAGTRVLGALGLTLMSTGAFAVPYYWTDWTGSDLDPGAGFQAQGSMTTPTSTIGVTYTNARGVGFYQATGGTDYYTNRGAGTSPYESTLVDNRPTGTDIIALQYAGSQTLSFTEAIANPVFAFVSLNFNGYGFDQDFEILSVGGEGGNACGYWGCGGITKSIVDLGGGRFEYQLNASNVGGSEPHGTIRFLGAFSTLTWRSPVQRILERVHRWRTGNRRRGSALRHRSDGRGLQQPAATAHVGAGTRHPGAVRPRAPRTRVDATPAALSRHHG